MASVEFEHVDKTYADGTRAVQDVSLAVADGELVVLVGPSGCGKSTLLRLLAGLESPTRGTIRIGDRIVDDLSPQQRNVAMVFQDYALYPYMTVRRNLEFPLRMARLPAAEIRRRVEATAAMLDLVEDLDRLPKHLSGGQRQRVAMGRALVREPDAFLLDEPLSNLDAKLRVQVRADIADLQRRTGGTMIYVTHDQVEAMTLGERVAVLDRGRLQQVAAPRELYDHPASVFVAGFIGSPPINLIPAQLTGDAGHPAIRVWGRLLRLKAAPPARDVAVTAGVRPEMLRLRLGEEARDAIPAVVEHTEYLGHETLAHLRVEAPGDAEPTHLVARLDGMLELPKGTRAGIEIDAGGIHLFGADGQAL